MMSCTQIKRNSMWNPPLRDDPTFLWASAEETHTHTHTTPATSGGGVSSETWGEPGRHASVIVLSDADLYDLVVSEVNQDDARGKVYLRLVDLR